jgi:hypothetical protein
MRKLEFEGYAPCLADLMQSPSSDLVGAKPPAYQCPERLRDLANALAPVG